MRRHLGISLFRPLITLFPAALCLSLVSCAVAETNVTSQVVLKGLQNPAGVAFSPEGDLTVTDARGKVVVLEENKPVNHITGFDTQYWKKDESGKQWYGVGPLSVLWIQDTLVVTDAGKNDGEETLLFFDAPGLASTGAATNPVGPTSDDEADKGEGNLTGMSVSSDGKTIYVCGQGYDGKSWVLSADVEARTLQPLLSADDHGIETNSPMQTVFADDGTLYVLYSGKGGQVDGRIVQWDLKAKKPIAQWPIPELVNPMGMAHIEGNRFAVVENNWALDSVNKGCVAVVTLGENETASVQKTAVELDGPVACAFGPDDRLYVANLGSEFDQPGGSVVAVSGLK